MLLPQPDCLAKVTTMLQTGQLANTSSYFHVNSTGGFENDPNGIINLTIEGCEALCGAGFATYSVSEIFERLITWFFPMALLLGNLQLSPLGFRWGVWTIIHALGDPIDSIWSLLCKFELARNCFSAVDQIVKSRFPDVTVDLTDRIDIATMMVAFDEDTVDEELRTTSIYHRIEILLDNATWDDARQKFRKAGKHLRDERIDQTFRTILAVGSYLHSPASDFLAVISGPGSSDPPGHRIEYPVILSWLLTLVLLSAAAGGFASNQSCERVVRHLCESFGSAQQLGFQPCKDSKKYIRSIYTYRPHKRISDNWRLSFLAFFAVVFAILFSAWLSWIMPTKGFDCHSIMELTILGVWIFSAFLTWSTWKIKRFQKYHVRIVFVKDAVVSLAVTLPILLASIGVFESCWCIGSVFSNGSNAYVGLNAAGMMIQNAKGIDPGLMYGAYLVQFIMYCGIRLEYLASRRIFVKEASSSRLETRGLTIADSMPERSESGHSSSANKPLLSPSPGEEDQIR